MSLSPPAPTIVVNGVPLTEEQVHTLRMMLENFLYALDEPGAHTEGHGQGLAAFYRARGREILRLLVEDR